MGILHSSRGLQEIVRDGRQSSNDLRRNVVMSCLKVMTDDATRTDDGRLFHICGMGVGAGKHDSTISSKANHRVGKNINSCHGQ